jgi:hypothetical protein
MNMCVATFTYEKNLEFFNVPVLTIVDNYHQVVLDVMIQEVS